MSGRIRRRPNGEYDFGQLENSAAELMRRGRYADAIKLYLYMADGDRSLDGGWLGWRLGQCYEALGDPHAARYWHGRAVEENPAARERLASLSIEALIIAD